MPKLKRPSLILNHFEDYLKTMKEICKDSENELKRFLIISGNNDQNLIF